MSVVRAYTTSPSLVKIDWASLMSALRKKGTARLVIYGYGESCWATALMDARRLINQMLASQIRAGIAGAVWSVLACLILWWLPVRPKGIDLAYLIPLAASIALFQAAGAVTATRLRKKLVKVVTCLLRTAPARQPKMAPPAHLWAKAKTPKSKKHRALIAALVLALFITTIGQVAIPIPGHWAVITSSNGEQHAAHAPTGLGMGDRWLLVPIHISGYAYGVITYDEPAQKLLVVRFDYSMANPAGLLSPTEVQEKMNSYASNMAHSIGTNLDAIAPVGVNRLDWSYFTLQEDDRIAGLLEGAVRTAAGTQFESSVSIRVVFEVISLTKYRNYLKK